jgi:O-acetyl-ADP-ribose deacetylase
MAQVTVGTTVVEITRGDITRTTADAIVNAANESLSGGGGVDGAIHRVGGPSIMEECRRVGTCPKGSAVMTRAGRLPAAHVIQAVAPRYSGQTQDAELLRSAYEASLQLATEAQARSIAFPSLGTGAYGYPIAEASDIAMRTIFDYVKNVPGLERVIIVLFSEYDYRIYESTLQALLTN